MDAKKQGGSALRAGLCALVMLLCACDPGSGSGSVSSASPEQAADPGDGAKDAPITQNPETEGESLFLRSANPSQNVAGFEFCCGQYDTYQEHEFVNATGAFLKLDGGFWASGIAGALGERVFSSAGTGYDDESDPSGEPIGAPATGTVTSPSFVIDANYINFLIGGGANRFDAANATAVVLVVNGEIVRQAHGQNQASALAWESWDVSDLLGQTAEVRFIDFHPGDRSDAAVPYLLADEFRAADLAAVEPAADSVVPSVALALTGSPASEGVAAYVDPLNPQEDIAGFEICCGGFDFYQQRGFLASGDFIRFGNGQWASGLSNAIGERVFSSYGQGYADPEDATGSWYGWEATGTLTTPSFVIGERYINFLIGGGTNAYDGERATAMVLRVNGKVVRQVVGNGQELALSWASWEVSGLIGQTALIEIIDRHDDSVSDGSYPFILVDQIRQAGEAAAAPTTDSIISQASGHDRPLLLDMGDPNPFYDDGVYHVFYLQNRGYHDWALSRTDDLLRGSFPEVVLEASADPTQQDEWVGSGSVMRDQQGGYHLFYSGHNAAHTPVEAVMHAVATDDTLKHWQPIGADTFSGGNGYSDFDFRDPQVFWNAAESRYWMLLTSRYLSEAAIALYTSDDLSQWTAQQPLYTESSPLNHEVPDYFTLGGSSFIVYSDQRDSSHQVKYLLPYSLACWHQPDEYQALDGRAFYAARSAGDASERLLFGWVEHQHGRQDDEAAEWAGNLMVHELGVSNGELAVSLPQRLRDALSASLGTGIVWSQGSVTTNGGGVDLGSASAFTLAASATRNRLSFGVNSAVSDSVWGIRFRQVAGGAGVADAYLEIDAANDTAEFYFDGEAGQSTNPLVSVPLDTAAGIDIEISLDPEAGVGAVYMNRFRALSFRLYALSDYEIGLYTTSDAMSVTDLERYGAP